MNPKTWTKKEIVALILAEIEAYRKDCTDRQVKFSYADMAECIYQELDEHFLIERTP